MGKILRFATALIGLRGVGILAAFYVCVGFTRSWPPRGLEAG